MSARSASAATSSRVRVGASVAGAVSTGLRADGMMVARTLGAPIPRATARSLTRVANRTRGVGGALCTMGMWFTVQVPRLRAVSALTTGVISLSQPA